MAVINGSHGATALVDMADFVVGAEGGRLISMFGQTIPHLKSAGPQRPDQPI